MERYICIHGHFYQPPRENPWLDSSGDGGFCLSLSRLERKDHSGVLRTQCHVPPSGRDRAYYKDCEQLQQDQFQLWAHPAHLARKKAKDVHQAILDADRESQSIFSGHGSALAQAYNHMILPLAVSRDKYTQILWGIRDFEHRFKRTPEGMWLPETAVDLESLEIMAELGIKFTVLAQHQAIRARRMGENIWHDVSGGRIDPTTPYSLPLPSGQRIILFFYDGPISRAVAFEGLLRDGKYLAERLLGAFSDNRDWPQLVSIATDGETYGHHFRSGDLALPLPFTHIESNKLARLTNYGEYLDKHPSAWEVEIAENTSWGCSHGVETMAQRLRLQDSDTCGMESELALPLARGL